MNFDQVDPILRLAYRRIERIPDFIAPMIRAWTLAFDGSATATLGASERMLLELGLCTRPRKDQWTDDVLAISEAIGLDFERLVSFLRAAEAIERFAYAPSINDREDGRLLAARDRDDGAEE